ncbi:MAG: hypothetical protein GY869_23325, partial [Planctomycetes bacterium]|nr:hypothetical protein [Planctomycetota bacterium]
MAGVADCASHKKQIDREPMMVEATKLRFACYRKAMMVFMPTIILLVSTCILPVQAQNTMTLEHIAGLRYVGVVIISPDGKQIAYTLNVPRMPFAEDDGSKWVELHVVDTDGNSRPFVTGEVKVDKIAWTPDGKFISYLAKRGGDEQKSLYVIPIDGGESRKLLEHGTAIKSYCWGPGGRLAFLAAERRSEVSEDLHEEGFTQEVYEEELFPVRVWLAEPFDSVVKPHKLDL